MALSVTGAEVPRTIVYQGRLLDHDTLNPVQGNFTKNFLVLIRRLSSPDQSSTPLLSRTINDVIINDGLFTLSIDVQSVGNEPVLTFDEPYFLEVIMGDQSSGGKVGQQVLFSHPYAIGSENVLLLNGNSPSAYALRSHGHSTPATSTFLIDGSNQVLSGETQFKIINDNGTVFSIDENAKMSSLRNIRASTDIITNDHFMTGTDLGTNNAVTIVQVTRTGDFLATHDVSKGTLSVAGHVKVTNGLYGYNSASSQSNITNSFHFSRILLDPGDIPTDSIRFSDGATIVQQGSTNIIGNSHAIEDHVLAENSQLKSELMTLAGCIVELNSQQVVCNQPTITVQGYHSHVYENKELSSFPTNFVESKLILNGELNNPEFSNDPNSLIDDTKLGTISTPGKISLSAVPTEVALTSQNNDFSNPFPLTQSNFDKFLSKALTVASSIDDRVDGAFPLLSFKDNNITQANLFNYSFKSNGDLVFSREVTPISSFAFESPGNRSVTFFRANEVRFEDLDGAPSLSFFDGSVIADGSITSIDLANNAITSLKIADLSVSTADISSDAIIESKLFGQITSRSIDTGAVTTDKVSDNNLVTADFQDNSITANDFADGTLRASRFASETITDGKIAIGTLVNSKFCDDINCLGSELLEASVFDNKAFTSGKIVTSANLISNQKLSAEVLANRTQPMQISTDAMQIVTLGASNYMTMIDMTLNALVAQNDFSAGFEITTASGGRIASLNNNGTISLSFARSSTNAAQVTLTPKFAAILSGVSDAAGNCGNGDTKMTVLTRGSNNDCISSQINHGIAELAFFDALNVCRSNGYQLCDMNQYYNACKSGILSSTEESLGRQLLTSSLAPVFEVKNSNNCNDATGDFSIDKADITTSSKNFRCCLKH